MPDLAQVRSDLLKVERELRAHGFRCEWQSKSKARKDRARSTTVYGWSVGSATILVVVFGVRGTPHAYTVFLQASVVPMVASDIEAIQKFVKHLQRSGLA